MRHLARRKQRVAWLEPRPILSDLNDELAFKCEEPLVLVVMQVPCRAAFRVECVLEYKEAAAVVRDNLKVNRANAKSPMLTESVFTSRDPERARNARRGTRRLGHTRLLRLWREEDTLAPRL